MDKPITVMMTFSNPILVRAIKDLLGDNNAVNLREIPLSSVTCEDEKNIDVILCETEVLSVLEQQHVCLAPRALGISVWNNMLSISKGDLQSYNDLEEIVNYIIQIGKQSHINVKCEACGTDSQKKI